MKRWLDCIRFLVAVGFSLLLGARAAVAQSALGEPTLQFRVIGFGEELFEGLRYESARGEAREVSFQADRRSDLHPVFGGARTIEFFREEADARGQTRRATQAVARIEDGVEVALIVFLGEGLATGGGQPYRLIVLDESERAFGPGAVRFLNLTSAPLDARLGERAFRLDPYSAATARLDMQERRPADFSLFVDFGGRSRLVCSTRFLPDPLYGLLYAIKPPDDPRSLRVRFEKLW